MRFTFDLFFFFRFLTTGDSFQTISFSYRLGHSTVYNIVRDTCRVICDNLMSEVLPNPNEEMWKSIAEDYYSLWNFPNCLGALDGKHITIQAPPNSGSLYFNYKKTFSVVLLALVDAHYNFIAVDVGSYGKNSDGGIFSNSNLGRAIEQNKLHIPQDEKLPNTALKLPYVFVADEGFPLKTYLMRPYPRQDVSDISKRIFNYRLCRTRRVVENAFGILAQKFRIYFRRLQATPENADYIILATCILHNFIKKYDGNTYSYETKDVNLHDPTNVTLERLPSQGGNATKDAFFVREMFTDFFNSSFGSIPWQDEKIEDMI